VNFDEPLLATLFITPMKLPEGARLWTFLPLALCIATVYRATRARHMGEMVRGTLIAFVHIVLGMVAIAAGAYLLHMLVLWLYFSN
jgi:hypothetical protein